MPTPNAPTLLGAPKKKGGRDNHLVPPYTGVHPKGFAKSSIWMRRTSYPLHTCFGRYPGSARPPSTHSLEGLSSPPARLQEWISVLCVASKDPLLSSCCIASVADQSLPMYGIPLIAISCQESLPQMSQVSRLSVTMEYDEMPPAMGNCLELGERKWPNSFNGF